MEVRQLNTLIRAAQFQSFSKAAESLGYSQSAVTVQIKALEEELGVRLFDRMGKAPLILRFLNDNFIFMNLNHLYVYVILNVSTRQVKI